MPTSPYDSLELVVNLARMRLNDMIQSAGGDVVTDSQPFIIHAINAAWRKMQERLAKLGFLRFKNEVFLSGLPPVQLFGLTASAAYYIDWTGVWDGASLTPYVALPQDLIAPEDLWEKWHFPSTYGYTKMDFLPDGIPPMPKDSINRVWTWRNERIYMPGSLTQEDFWLRYWSYAPDFVAASTTAFSAQPVPIARCADAFSAYLCAEIAGARGDLDAKGFTAAGEAACLVLVARENPLVLSQAEPAPPPPPGGNG